MEWKNEQIIIFGGSGFLGSNIARKLLKEGCSKVICFNRGPAPELKQLGAKVVRGDIGNRSAVVAAAAGCTAVIHTAAKTGVWGSSREYYRTNVVGTENVLASCRENRIKTLIFTSSPSVAYSPDTDVVNMNEQAPYPTSYLAHYPATKAIAEKKALGEPNKNLAVVALRPHLIWGPGDRQLLPRVIHRAAEGKLRIIGNGRNLVDLTYIDNAVQAHLDAIGFLRKNGGMPLRKVYFISDNAPVAIWEWLNDVLQHLGVPPITRKIEYRRALAVAGMLEWLFKIPFLGEPPLTKFTVGQLAFSHYFDISAAGNDLGYKPVVEPADAMRAAIVWLREYVLPQVKGHNAPASVSSDASVNPRS